MGKLLNHLGHNRHQQNADHRHGHHRQGDGVNHRLGELAFHLLALFVVFGQLFQHIAEVPGLFPGHHQRAVELVKGARKLAEGVEQGMPFHHLVADIRHHRRQFFIFRLLGDRLQGAFQRQRGVNQGCKLAGKHRQHGGGELYPLLRATAGGLLAGDGNAHRDQLLIAQRLTHLLWPLGL